MPTIEAGLFLIAKLQVLMFAVRKNIVCCVDPFHCQDSGHNCILAFY